eukprot:jgi/Hompol1/5736/HPOL_002526-RA
MLTEWLAAQTNERIFLFNRLALDPRSAPDQLVNMSIDIEPPVPTDGVIGIKAVLPLGPEVDSISRARSFMQAFQGHVDYGQALLRIANKHADTCERLMNEQLVAKTLQMKSAIGIMANNTQFEHIDATDYE